MTVADEVSEYIVREYLPEIKPNELDPSFDLFESGVVHSLSMLRLIRWLRDRYGIPVDDLEISPDNFRSVDAIQRLVTNAQRAG